MSTTKNMWDGAYNYPLREKYRSTFAMAKSFPAKPRTGSRKPHAFYENGMRVYGKKKHIGG